MDTKGSFSKEKKNHFLQVQTIGYPQTLKPNPPETPVVINRRKEALGLTACLPRSGPWTDVPFLHLCKRLELIAFQECD